MAGGPHGRHGRCDRQHGRWGVACPPCPGALGCNVPAYHCPTPLPCWPPRCCPPRGPWGQVCSSPPRVKKSRIPSPIATHTTGHWCIVIQSDLQRRATHQHPHWGVHLAGQRGRYMANPLHLPIVLARCRKAVGSHLKIGVHISAVINYLQHVCAGHPTLDATQFHQAQLNMCRSGAHRAAIAAPPPPLCCSAPTTALLQCPHHCPIGALPPLLCYSAATTALPQRCHYSYVTALPLLPYWSAAITALLQRCRHCFATALPWLLCYSAAIAALLQRCHYCFVTALPLLLCYSAATTALLQRCAALSLLLCYSAATMQGSYACGGQVVQWGCLICTWGGAEACHGAHTHELWCSCTVVKL